MGRSLLKAKNRADHTDIAPFGSLDEATFRRSKEASLIKRQATSEIAAREEGVDLVGEGGDGVS
jgi:DNA replication initiation complex subunit (GINS family)